jgi:predicted nuclease of restriction endonuclease-like (RecB) superfamily
MDFESLVNKIQSANFHLQQNAIKAVNIHLTIRNWIIGFYIVEFEQYGEDRAEYGSQLLELLAKKIKVRGLSETNLKICRQFYKVYYQFRVLLNKKIDILIPIQIRQTVTDEFRTFDMEKDSIRQTASDELKETTKRQKDIDYLYQLLGSTSYSHFIELSKIEDDVKRNFYELLILKTTPSLKELQRQINTLTFERLGLTGNYQSSFEQVKLKIKPEQSSDIVKSHYFFEFLEINYPQLIEESELEQALINHLQQFIIELGNGFCFEARQKRVLIGDEYFFIDLVFYHRILKCHILVELKTMKANYEHIGQLRTYISYYKKNVTQPNDNPPVGILLVTDQNKTLVEYAVAESDKEIFVSKYLLQLPDKEQLASFINNEIKNL